MMFLSSRSHARPSVQPSSVQPSSSAHPVARLAQPSRRATLTTLALGLGTLALGAAAGCAKKARCATCGMVLDPQNRFATELQTADGRTTMFDTPKCAFTALRAPNAGPLATAELFARGYYSQTRLSAKALLFAKGSDVFGPMGIDFVPVERENAPRFAQEHEAKAMLEAAAITAEVVRDLS